MGIVARFSSRCAKAIEDLDSCVSRFILYPTADNIHDIRTAIRRMESSLDLLPKKIRRKRKTKEYLSACKRLFKSSTPVRDKDIIYSNLLKYSSDSRVQDTLSGIRHERGQLILLCLDYAKDLSRLRKPKIDKNDLSPWALQKRRSKTIAKIQAKLQEGMPMILKDFRKIDELHDIRKECKMLRYTLEILPTDRERKLAGLMEEWQAILGGIRDVDVTEHFINERGLSEDLERVIVDLKKSRDKMLGSFRRRAKLDALYVTSN